jgi:AcrR family transcriptional regulator
MDDRKITLSISPGQPLSLRERKKRLTQKTIEETALRLFKERGYEQTSIQDIAEEIMISSRTFFRYFSSKEEVLVAPTLAVMQEGIRYLGEIEVITSPFLALKAVLLHMAGQYEEQWEIFLLCFQLAMKTPQLSYLFATSQFITEPPLCDILCDRSAGEDNRREMRLLVSIMMAAFRETLVQWLEEEARGELKVILRENLDSLDTLLK